VARGEVGAMRPSEGPGESHGGPTLPSLRVRRGGGPERHAARARRTQEVSRAGGKEVARPEDGDDSQAPRAAHPALPDVHVRRAAHEGGCACNEGPLILTFGCGSPRHATRPRLEGHPARRDPGPGVRNAGWVRRPCLRSFHPSDGSVGRRHVPWKRAGDEAAGPRSRRCGPPGPPLPHSPRSGRDRAVRMVARACVPET
jgi:hypothetical protein